MFCYQCQETAKNSGCTIRGVCGKNSDVADMQDLLLHTIKEIAYLSSKLKSHGGDIAYQNRFIIKSLFMTITNANFDEERFVEQVREAHKMRDKLAEDLSIAGAKQEECSLFDPQWWDFHTKTQMLEKAKTVGVLATENEDIRSLRELLIYGLKGLAAYAHHAMHLGYEEDAIYDFIRQALIATTKDLSAEKLTQWVLDCGAFGVKTMALLDRANTSTYGEPRITRVNIGVRNNPGILVSGHDLRDLHELLEQSKGSGVDIYTHSEMLPAHYYPMFRKYDNLVGNYGSSWWKQLEDFESFNGVVLFTTNCIVPPKATATYTDRVYTTGASGFTGFKHIAEGKHGKPKDFSQIIEHAKKCKAPTQIESGEIVGGFAHAQVFVIADKIVEAVKSGAIRKFIVMAGCDGRMKNRDYYTQFAQQLPKDTVILTAGCAKYRYNKLSLGEINGIPRVLDAGQCNDSYSIAVIALKLKEVFQLSDINNLPVSYNIAWYEQKAVIVLLSLLSLGIKNIHIGPTLPGFLSPNIKNILIERFGLSGIDSVDEDIKILLVSDKK